MGWGSGGGGWVVIFASKVPHHGWPVKTVITEFKHRIAEWLHNAPRRGTDDLDRLSTPPMLYMLNNALTRSSKHTAHGGNFLNSVKPSVAVWFHNELVLLKSKHTEVKKDAI